MSKHLEKDEDKNWRRQVTKELADDWEDSFYDEGGDDEGDDDEVEDPDYFRGLEERLRIKKAEDEELLSDCSPGGNLRHLVRKFGSIHALGNNVLLDRPVDGFGRYDGNPVTIAIPHGQAFLDKNYGSYRWLRKFDGVYEAYFESLDTTQILREGKVLQSGNSVFVLPGIRRHVRPNERAIAIGCYVCDMLNPLPEDEGGWRHLCPSREFYTDNIGPHFINDKTTDPLAWATRRTQVAAGYVYNSGKGGDCPLYPLQNPFMQMAPVVCNSTPEELIQAREFRLDDEESQRWFAEIKTALGSSFCAETAWMVLKNSDFITPEFLADEEISELFSDISTCLENGFVIDRFQELVTSQINTGVSPAEAFRFALRIIVCIFGSGEKPWWFKENFNICSAFDFDGTSAPENDTRRKINPDDAGRRLVSAIANEAEFYFTYAIETYKSGGYKIFEIPGVSFRAGVKFVCDIAKSYGICNLKRAAKIIDFACAHAMEVPPEQRDKSLELFATHSKRGKPSTEISGRMEGDLPSIHMPGLPHLASLCRGNKGLEELGDGLFFPSHSDLQAVVAPLAASLEDRVKLIPRVVQAFLPQEVPHKLLAASTGAAHLSLPAPASEEVGVVPFMQTPSNSIMTLFERAHEECGWAYHQERVLKLYFSMYAMKFPNPFDPPKGFLGFLKKFLEIPNESVSRAESALFFEKCRRAHESGGSAYQKETERIVKTGIKADINRNLVVSNLLDAHVMGLLAWEEVERIFNWITVEPDKKTMGKIKRRVEAILKKRKKAAENGPYPFTPAHEENFRHHNLARLTKETMDPIHLRRVHIAEDGVNFVAAVNILLPMELISSDGFRQMITEHFRMMPMTEESYPDYASASSCPLLNERLRSETVEILKKLSGWDVFDFEAFAETLSAESDFEKKFAIVREYFFCVNAYRKAVTVTENYKNLVVSDLEEVRAEIHEGKDPAVPERLIEILRDMELALRDVWKLTPLIADIVTDKIIDEFLSSILKEHFNPDYEAVSAIQRLGVFDKDRFERSAAGLSLYERRATYIREILKCGHAYRKSQKKIMDFDSTYGMRRNLSSIVPAAEKLSQELGVLWVDVNIVTSDVVEVLMREVLSSVHYTQILQVIRETRAASFLIRKVDEGHPEGLSDPSSKPGGFATVLEAATALYEKLRPSLVTRNTRTATETSLTALLSVSTASAIARQIAAEVASQPRALLTSGAEVDVGGEIAESSPRPEITLFRPEAYSDKSITEIVAAHSDKIIDELRMHRRENLGLLSIGGKLHIKGFNEAKLQLIKNLLGLSSTPFHFKIMDGAICLPASISAFELKAIVYLLIRAGVVDPKNLQLQLAVPGRLSPRSASVLGCTVLLATKFGVQYAEDSFTSSSTKTGSRIMLYDADPGATTQLPFIKGFPGRTDMGGRMTPEDVDLYQLLGTVLVHDEYKGPFGKFAEEFKERFMEILERHGLSDVINENWIYINDAEHNDEESSMSHFHDVRKVTDAYFFCAEEAKRTGEAKGIIYEVRDLIRRLKQSVSAEQKKLYDNISTCQEAEFVVDF